MSIKNMFLALTLGLAGVSFADVIQPSGDSSGATDTAAIQTALDSGGTVTLGEGTFYLNAGLSLANAVTLQGQGWEKTILQQTAKFRVMKLDGASTVKKVTLTGGNAQGNWQGGAGALVVNGTVSWCRVANNTTDSGNNQYGGGIGFPEWGKGQIDHSIIEGNKLVSAGASAYGGGIGIYRPGDTIVIDSCLIRNNSSVGSTGAGYGGGVCVEFLYSAKSVKIRNTTIVGNQAGTKATAEGGAVCTKTDSNKKLQMTNCIVADNVTYGAESDLKLSYAGGVDYCLFDKAADKNGTNSKVGDPLFNDAASGDYTITQESPAKGAGTTYTGIGSDLAGVAFATPPSMGCYEYVASTTVVENPTFDPLSCAFVSPLQVTLDCTTVGSTIRYTTDGSDPTESSTAYTEPVVVSGATMTIKARAYKAGMDPSKVVSATYTHEAAVPPAFGTVTVTPKPKKAAFAGTIATVGNDGATACDVWIACGTDAANLPTATKLVAGATSAFGCAVTGLTPETTYYYTLSLSNNAATVRGVATSGSFTTLAAAGAIEPAETAAENREAIQEAIDDAVAEPGTVTLSTGTFLIDAQLMVTGGVTLVGQGWTNTVVKQTSSGQRCATVNNGSKLVGVTLTGGKTVANWVHGAGVSVQDGTVSWCCISNNVATAYNIYGAGVEFKKGTIDHSVIAFNQAWHSGTGAGIGFNGPVGPCVIDSCLVYGNAMPDSNGGGIGFTGANPVITIRNTTITDNSSKAEGAGLKFATTKLTLINSIVSGNKKGDAEDNISGTLKADSSNNLIGGEPGFKDAANRDYSLAANSPARGAGVTYEGIGTDLADAPFANPPSVGCYEYVSSLTVVENPFFEPETGAAFSTPLAVTLICGTDGATIHYTTDGSDPTEASAAYEAPVVVSETTTVKALAVKAGMEPSEVVSATYTYEDPVPPELGELTVVPDMRKAKFIGEIVSVGNDWATACDVYVAVGPDAENLPAATKVFGGAVDSFKFAVPDLEPETTYAYALFVTNNAATARGVSMSGSFTTRATPLAIAPAGSPAETRLVIQTALDDEAALATPGTVLLAEGLFEIDAQLTLDGGVTLAGQGWDKTVIRQTAAAGANSRVVSISGGAKVEKVTLTGGRVIGNWNSGAGALVNGGSISWCCITNNALGTGNCMYGGGVYFGSGNGQIDHSIVVDNLAQATTGTAAFGGGVCIRSAGEVTVDACLILSNRVVNLDNSGQGGGVYLESLYSPAAIRNTTFVGNTGGEGGAVDWVSGTKGNLSVLNCIFADNVTAGTNLTVKLVYTNGVDYCLVGDELDRIGEHSLVGDPKFREAEANDYRLGAGSPAQNAGVRYAGLDRDLNNVSFATRPSMGCYERRCGLTLIVR